MTKGLYVVDGHFMRILIDRFWCTFSAFCFFLRVFVIYYYNNYNDK